MPQINFPAKTSQACWVKKRKVIYCCFQSTPFLWSWVRVISFAHHAGAVDCDAGRANPFATAESTSEEGEKTRGKGKGIPEIQPKKVKEQGSKTRRLRKSKSKQDMGTIKGDTPGSKRKKTKGLKDDKNEESTKGKGSGGRRGRPPINTDDGQEYGCSRCRQAKLGCKTCRQPGFKPRGPRKKTSADCGANADKGEPAQPRKRASKSARADGEKTPLSRKRTKKYEIPDVD